MNLREKLRYLDSRSLSGAGGVSHVPADDSAERKVLGGANLRTPLGECWRVQTVYHKSFRHGRAVLSELLDHKGVNLELVSRGALSDPLNPEDLIFLDTETTGLAGGTGTYVFLAGVGRFSGDKFTINQFLMRDFAQERALLWAVDRELSRGGVLVTYNGATYDAPLLSSRFVMQRLPTVLGELRHLDLLHVVRRLFKRRIGSCALTNVETSLLGHHRVDDLPGHLIPGIFFQYLRSRDPAPLVKVLEHNVSDILALVAVLVEAIRLAVKPSGKEGLDLLSLGAFYQDMGLEREAAGFFRLALDSSVPPMYRRELLRRAGLCYKRLGLFDEAEKVWRTMIRESFLPDLHPYEELAKLYEHRKRDYFQARNWVQEAAAKLQTARSLGLISIGGNEMGRISHRLSRLERKIRKSAAPGWRARENRGAGSRKAFSATWKEVG